MSFHLVVVQHGLHGSATQLEHISQRVSEQLSQQCIDAEQQQEYCKSSMNSRRSGAKTVVAHLAASNDFFRATQQGIDVCGSRLADEIVDVAQRMVVSSSNNERIASDGARDDCVDDDPAPRQLSVVNIGEAKTPETTFFGNANAVVANAADNNNAISTNDHTEEQKRENRIPFSVVRSDTRQSSNTTGPGDHGETSEVEIVELSLIGHSLGGLISRFAVGELLRRQLVSLDVDRLAGNSAADGAAQPLEKTQSTGRQIRFRLVNFVSLASPHVGSRRPQRSLFGKLVHFYCNKLASRTGAQLLLEDVDAPQPLLETMSDPTGVFFRALEMFQVRILVANTCNDSQVGYCTAAISHWNPLRVAGFETYYERPKPGTTRLRLRNTSGDCANNSGSTIHSNNTTNSSSIDNNEKLSQMNLNRTLVDDVSALLEEPISRHPIDSAGIQIPDEAFANDVKGDILRRIVFNLRRLGFIRIDAYIESVLAHDHVACRWHKFTPHGEDLLDAILEHLIA